MHYFVFLFFSFFPKSINAIFNVQGACHPLTDYVEWSGDLTSRGSIYLHHPVDALGRPVD